MASRIKTDEFALLDAVALCPVCKGLHNFRLNPLYPPPPANTRSDRPPRGVSYRTASWAEKVKYWSFRVTCDTCTAARCSPRMREQLAKKGWDVK